MHMAIYGTALLASCLIVGLILGELTGMAMGIDANVGGVGLAMLLLIVACSKLRQSGLLSQPTQNGVLFWSAIYIPIVVAMAATQNVRAAVTSGPAAIAAGALATAVCFALVPLIDRLGPPQSRDGWRGADQSPAANEKEP